MGAQPLLGASARLRPHLARQTRISQIRSYTSSGRASFGPSGCTLQTSSAHGLDLTTEHVCPSLRLPPGVCNRASSFTNNLVNTRVQGTVQGWSEYRRSCRSAPELTDQTCLAAVTDMMTGDQSDKHNDLVFRAVPQSTISRPPD